MEKNKVVQDITNIGKRVLGAIIDIIFLTIITVIYGMIFGTVHGFSISVTGIPAAILFLIIFLYFVILEAITGKTIGKYISKTRVVNEAGNRISWGQSIGRNIMRIIDGILFYLVGFIAIIKSKDKQRLGDMISKTYVVNN